MDLDFDDQPSDLAAPAAKAGARFKPRGRPQPKKKQVSTDVAKEKLSTQSEDSVSLDESSVFPNKDLTSETLVPETGARFKPEGGPQPDKKRVSFSLPTDVAEEKLSMQNEDSVSLDESSTYPNKDSTSETVMPESGTINQSEENLDICPGGVKWPMRPSILRASTEVHSEGKICDDGIETASTFHDDPRTQESATGDFVTPATEEDIDAQIERMQTEEEECSLDMESLDIVQEEGTTSTYVQHTGKLQPKPRLLETAIEEPESHYPADDNNVYYSMGTNESEFTVNVESRNDFNTDTTFFGEFQEEEHSIAEVPRETVPEMEARNASEHEEQVVEEEGTGKESSKKRKSKRGRKRKTTSQDEPNTSSENPEKKKFKHASRRQKKRTLEKELLETPDHEIRYLPIRDMLRLVDYKERLEKKEAKGATVVPPTQESNTNASDNQYYSQGYDEEDEYAMEEGENQEVNVVKPDSPVNYQTYMNKTPRTRWSKEDTELFYEGIREFGSNLSMVQQLFPDRTRQQIKLKFKLEERRFPLKLNDALSSRSKHLTHFQNVIKKLQREAAAAKEAEEEEEEEEEQEEAGAEAETTDVPENEEPAKSEETERTADGVAGVKESDGGDECDDEADDGYWNSYKSDM